MRNTKIKTKQEIQNNKNKNQARNTKQKETTICDQVAGSGR